MATAAATGGPNHVAREARRRRIIERGSDRLALISGRIQSLPPDPDQSLSSEVPPTESSQHEDAAPSSLLPNEESVQEQGQEHGQHAASDLKVEPPPPLNSYNGGSIPPSRSSVALHGTNEESSQIPSSAQQRPVQDRQGEQSLFTSGKIRSAIAASENTRMYCSIAAAFLVIASYMGLPIVGFRGIMLFRTFYLILLTNITVVLGHLIVGARGVESRTRRSSAGGNDLADQLGRALELGLLMQKILGAVSMDFSIYAVVLVSGLSLVQKLGSH